jgi:hypothetical protein
MKETNQESGTILYLLRLFLPEMLLDIISEISKAERTEFGKAFTKKNSFLFLMSIRDDCCSTG